MNELFDAATERDAGERARFLAEACGSDAELRSEVESLLATDERAGVFLRNATQARLAPPAPMPTLEGTRIGAYRVARRLAVGGMGSVWLGQRDDAQFHKTVAIKVIKRGMDSDAILRRFLNERQVLAGLDHPNIARLLDGGMTDDGTPYLIMEFVDGKPIDEFCDDNLLAVSERVRLFRKVCDAVQYAHRHLVIHRDLKPANILVTADGEPKLLDFGIAKLLRTDLATTMTRTAAGEQAMTPEYASPEQVRGEAVSTQSDVYSLGVVLYELLTGQRPYDTGGGSLTEIARAICEIEPRRPSTVIDRPVQRESAGTIIKRDAYAIGAARRVDPRRLKRNLSGDLDTIVLMALRKEAARRYASVEAFAEDLRRHEVGLPVRARPDTLGYRASKFVRRNVLPVTLVSALFVLLASAVAVTTWQAGEIREQRNVAVAANEVAGRERDRARSEAEAAQAARDRAEVEALKSRNLAGYLQSMLASIDPDVARDRDTSVLQELFDRTDEAAGVRLADQPEVLAAVRFTLGEGYRRLGRLSDAKRNLEESLKLRESLPHPDPTEVAGTLNELGSLARDQGDYETSLLLTKQAIDKLVPIHGEDSVLVGNGKNNLALLMLDAGKYEDAEKLFREAIDIFHQHAAGDDAVLSNSANNLGLLLKRKGRYAEARALYEEAIERATRRFGRIAARVGLYSSNLAALHEATGDFESAERMYRDAIAVQRDVHKQGHSDLAVTLDNLGRLLCSRGRADEAEPMILEALDMLRREMGEDHPDVLICLANLSVVRRSMGDYAEAEQLARQAYDGVLREVGPRHPKTAMLTQPLAAALRDQGRLDEALELTEAARNTMRRALGEKHTFSINVSMSLVRIEFLRGNLERAEALCRETLEAATANMTQTEPTRTEAISYLGQILAAAGKLDEAEPLLREALAIRERTLDARHEMVLESRRHLGECLTARRCYPDAEPLLLDAAEPPSRIWVPSSWSQEKALRSVIALYEAWERPEAATPYRARLAELVE
ncbi:MAG: tetratricopeptide repeat protein [Phycisphaerae bacterium]